MAAEESLSKSIYRIELCSIKIIPIVISGIYLLNTTLSYFNIDIPLLSYIVTALLIAFLYLSSIAFRFCKWHRMFIHYITCNLCINTLDYYIGIPLGDRELFIMYIIITGIFMFLIIYCKQHECTNKTCPKGIKKGC